MESKEYFYLNGDAKVGPLSLDALKYAPISPTTMVWNNSLPDWVEARSLPELANKFFATPAPPPAPPPVTPSYSATRSGFNDSTMKPPMPDNYLVWAILTTVLCCLPLGIVSIINATKVSSAYTMGDYTGAQKASDDAKKWAIWSAVSALIIGVLYVLFFIGLGAAGILSDL